MNIPLFNRFLITFAVIAVSFSSCQDTGGKDGKDKPSCTITDTYDFADRKVRCTLTCSGDCGPKTPCELWEAPSMKKWREVFPNEDEAKKQYEGRIWKKTVFPGVDKKAIYSPDLDYTCSCDDPNLHKDNLVIFSSGNFVEGSEKFLKPH